MRFENLLLGGETVAIEVEGGKIAAVEKTAPTEGIRPRPVAPAFYNCHTHLPMNLLRGYADDLKLMPWLQEHIWPAEAHLTDEIVYAGARLAMLEMVKSGTVFANDMYWHASAVARAAVDAGVRCACAMQSIETGGPGMEDPRNTAENAKLATMPRTGAAKVFATYAAHAVYTVCEKTLKRIAAQAGDEGSFLHVHVSETRGEVEDCRRAHEGRTPVRYLADCGMLGPRTVMAHCVHLTDDDVKIIADSGAVVCENQQSNMKLVSGLFPYRRVAEGGCRMALGTDGASSNNSLSMFAEMKCVALAAKIESGDPECAPAKDVFATATKGGAAAFGIDAGEIRVGAEADFTVYRPDAVPLVPGYDLASDLVYAADPSCIDTVVCGGKVLMEGGVVPGEEEIVEAARRAAEKLAGAARK